MRIPDRNETLARGTTMITSCGDTNTYGLIIWLGTKDEDAAKKLAGKTIRKLNANPHSPFIKTKEIKNVRAP